MLKAQKLTLAVVINAVLISSAYASEQSDAKDLLKVLRVLFYCAMVLSSAIKRKDCKIKILGFNRRCLILSLALLKARLVLLLV